MMELNYLDQALATLRPLQEQAIAEGTTESTAQGAILGAVIIALEFLGQNETHEALLQEAAAYIRASNGALGIQEWIDAIMRDVCEHGATRRPASMPERLAATSFFRKVTGVLN